MKRYRDWTQTTTLRTPIQFNSIQFDSIRFKDNQLQTINSFSCISFRDDAWASKYRTPFAKLCAKRKNTSCRLWLALQHRKFTTESLFFRCLLAGNRARSVLPDVNKALIHANFIYLQTRIIKYTVETICRRLLTDDKWEQTVQSAVSVIIGGREFSQPKSSIYQGKNSVEA